MRHLNDEGKPTKQDKSSKKKKNQQSQEVRRKEAVLLQVAAAVGVAGEDRRGGHAPSSWGAPLQSLVGTAVCRQHLSVVTKQGRDFSKQATHQHL